MDLAGKQARCSYCGQAVTVPIPLSEVGAPPPERVPVAEEAPPTEWPPEQPRNTSGFLVAMLLLAGTVVGGIVLAVVLINKRTEPPRQQQQQQQQQAYKQPNPTDRGPIVFEPPEQPRKRPSGPRDPQREPIVFEPPESSGTGSSGKAKASPKKTNRPDLSIQFPELTDDPEKEQPGPSTSEEVREANPITSTPTPGDNPEQEVDTTEYVKALKNRNPAERVKAAEALTKLGTRARSASRALCTALLDPSLSVRKAANAALEQVNPKLHPLVITALVDSDTQNRLQAVQALAELKSEGKPALSVLLRCFASMDEAVDASQVIDAIGIVAKDEPRITTWMAKQLGKDKRAECRISAGRALPAMAESTETIPQLLQSLANDKNAAVRQTAAWALGELKPKTSEVEKALVQAKMDADTEVRKEAADALKKIRGIPRG
jgi:hypothetical protein